MNVEAATMKVGDYRLAHDAYTAYRTAIKQGRATKDDVALARAYHAMLAGKKVLDVGLAIRHGGMNARHLPQLAIARADWPTVYVRSSPTYQPGPRPYVFAPKEYGSRGRRPKGQVQVRLETGLDPSLGLRTAHAQVPTIPPQYRPTNPQDYHLLFEAVYEPEPTRDPLLLRQLGAGDSPLFVVVAAWDLTPLEQAVLRAKL